MTTQPSNIGQYKNSGTKSYPPIKKNKNSVKRGRGSRR